MCWEPGVKGHCRGLLPFIGEDFVATRYADNLRLVQHRGRTPAPVTGSPYPLGEAKGVNCRRCHASRKSDSLADNLVSTS